MLAVFGLVTFLENCVYIYVFITTIGWHSFGVIRLINFLRASRSDEQAKAICLELLHNEPNSINCSKYYYGFQCLQEMNKFALNKYDYSLGWDVSIIRKKIKITKGGRKKPREYHT